MGIGIPPERRASVSPGRQRFETCIPIPMAVVSSNRPS
ncbi:hypothetical protein PVAG01_06257 [Phlyctema vagabunda]|uniref:Uncharacterized protein n=1 Tax=Phlyctema vagabunda TaxID=108571 RepID=A0ABR4PFJ1_9HELO